MEIYNRTTLIPKIGKDQADVGNWRPITIGSLMARIFSGVLDARLRSVVKQSIRQKGFTKEDGCKANINLLNAAIAEMKKAKGGVVTIVDISKAFDTMPHTVLKQCLARKGILSAASKYIRNMYNDCHTVIKASDDTVRIELKRGIKQGDPLSPLLFNLALDPIIEELTEETKGVDIGEENLLVWHLRIT